MAKSSLFDPITKADKVVAFPSGNRVILIRRPNKCCIVHFHKGRAKKLFEWEEIAGEILSVTPSIKYENVFYCGTSEGSVSIWNSESHTFNRIFSSTAPIRCLACEIFKSPSSDLEVEERLAIGSTDLKIIIGEQVMVMKEDHLNSYHVSLRWLEYQPDIILSLKDDGWLFAFRASTGEQLDKIDVGFSRNFKRDSEPQPRLSTVILHEKEFISIPSLNGVKILSFSGNFYEEGLCKPQKSGIAYFTRFYDEKFVLVGYLGSSLLDIYEIGDTLRLVSSVETNVDHQDMDVTRKGVFLIKNGEVFQARREQLLVSESFLERDPDGKKNISANSYIDDEAEEREEGSDDNISDHNEIGNLENINLHKPVGIPDSDSSNDDHHSDSTKSDFGNKSSINSMKESAIMQLRSQNKVFHPLVPIGYTPPYSGSQYLAYNTYGYVAKQGDQIKVYFHDNKPPVLLGERGGICLASLGENGVLIGSTTDIFYKAFRSYGMNSDWTVQFEPSEEVSLLSAGTRMLVVVTSRYIRIYTHAGLERAIFCAPHRPICLTMSTGCFGRAERDLCAIMYEIEELQYELHIYDALSGCMQQKVPVRIEKLKWMGWSSDGYFYLVDGKGVILMLTSSWGSSWSPMYDPLSSLGQSERYWVWSVTEDSFLGHKLIEDEEYPPFGQVGAEYVRLQVPISNSGGIQHMIQRECILRNTVKLDELKQKSRCYTSSIAEKDIQIDQANLKLFKSYVEEDFSAKAVEVGSSFELQSSIVEAVEYCHRKERIDLEKKLTRIREFRHKRKRVCELPEPNEEISEKERDIFLRKIILQHKNSRDTSQKSAPATGSELYGQDKVLEVPSLTQTTQSPNYVNVSAERQSIPSNISAQSVKAQNYFGNAQSQ